MTHNQVDIIELTVIIILNTYFFSEDKPVKSIVYDSYHSLLKTSTKAETRLR